MRRSILLLLLFLVPATGVLSLSAQDLHMDVAMRVLSSTPLIDGHNDLPWAIRGSEIAPHDVEADVHDLRQRTSFHTDIERLRSGMVGAQFWSVYIPFEATEEGAAKVQLEQIDIAQQIIVRTCFGRIRYSKRLWRSKDCFDAGYRRRARH